MVIIRTVVITNYFTRVFSTVKQKTFSFQIIYSSFIKPEEGAKSVAGRNYP